MSETPGKLRLGALVALVVGSMIGGGIFSLPQNMAASADVGAVLIGWIITAVGMLTLAFVFQTLANRKPDLDGGVYAYAKAGFGDYMGFSSAWGYWISAWLGNVGYFVLLFSTLGYFFPIFGEGNTPAAVIGASALLWAVHFLVLRGIKEAAFINLVTTVAKVVPLVLFVLIALFAFKLEIFTADIWGVKNPDLGSVMNQVRNMMLVTVWVFIGIEGASIFSSRAEKRSDVGKATVIGFITVLLFLMLVNVLSLGIMTQPELAKLQNPSMAAVLEHVVGHWGAVLISVGLIISLLGALLSWVLLCAEIMFAAAKDHTMPEFLRRENANHVPVNALWLTNAMVQLFLIITLPRSGFLMPQMSAVKMSSLKANTAINTNSSSGTTLATVVTRLMNAASLIPRSTRKCTAQSKIEAPMMAAGVLSLVLRRAPAGSARIEARRTFSGRL